MRGRKHINKGLIDRFLDRVIKDDNTGCWIWNSVVNNHGMALFSSSLNGQHFNQSARRFCWEQIKNNRLCDGIEIHTVCGNRLCVNPDHLYSRTQEQRFESSFIVGNENECWEWIGCKNEKGYGLISYNNKPSSKAHRIMWERTFGEIPKGLHVLHSCDNPPCVNPRHLFLGTHKDKI